MKLEEKIKAIKLRRKGKSYREIREQIPVSKGTLSLWLREIELTPEQKERLYVELRRKNAYKGAKANQEKRIKRTRQIISEAKKEAKLLIKEPLFLTGLMLYWAEGTKRSGESLRFSNSDPLMIEFMMRWFREICGIPEEKFRIALHIHALHCRRDIKRHWSKLTNIPFSQFHKIQVKPTSLRHRRNKLYNGTCVIVVNSRDLFRRVEGWRLGVLEELGFNPIAPIAQWIEQ